MPLIEVEGEPSAGLEPVPVGTYRVAVRKCEAKDARSSGKPTIAWELAIIEHPEFTGRKLFSNTSLQPQALWKLEEFLQALGVPHNAQQISADKRRISFNTEDAMDHVAMAQVGQTTRKSTRTGEDELVNEIGKLVRA